jgi:AcrR family transcriptional regulator
MASGATQAERSEATRGALVEVARELFASAGYADTSIEEIVRRAQVSRGALYHHFADKRDVFRAVYEEVERGLTETIAGVVVSETRPERRLIAGLDAFLDACLDPAVQRIVLLEAPAVLGWEEMHEIEARYGLGMTMAALENAMDEGVVERQPVAPLAQMLLGALTEAGLAIARADDVALARREFGAAAARLIAGLAP